MYWSYHGNPPAYFINFFVQNESIHSYNTRSATNIHIAFKQIIPNFLSDVKERLCGTVYLLILRALILSIVLKKA